MSSDPRSVKLAQILAVVVIGAILVPAALGAGKYKVLHNFGASNDGNFPSGPLLVDKAGNLYGATGGGPGEYGYGIVFELKHHANGTWAEEVLHDLTGGSDGAFPDGGLVFDNAGNLFGTVHGDLGGDVGGGRANSGLWRLEQHRDLW